MREVGKPAVALDLDTRSRSTRRAYWFYGDLVIVHVSGDETGGRFSLVEFVQPPGEWTPLHVHRDSDQTHYVLEGEVTLYLPGQSFVLRPGDCVNAPMNVPHTEHATSSTPVRLLDVNAPAGFDAFVAAAGEPAVTPTLPPADSSPPDVARLGAIAAEHAIELLGPPGALP
jgi:mannose-6-phosphate isomerase-like protein (cupin superfamily)